MSIIHDLHLAVDCGAPDPADPNGDLNIDRTTLGGKASYSCNAGYNLVGEAVATCQSNGEWSSKRPTCERKSFKVYYTIMFLL